MYNTFLRSLAEKGGWKVGWKCRRNQSDGKGGGKHSVVSQSQAARVESKSKRDHPTEGWKGNPRKKGSLFLRHQQKWTKAKETTLIF